jgi:thiol-disulfide isomerase/thioredoxin
VKARSIRLATIAAFVSGLAACASPVTSLPVRDANELTQGSAFTVVTFFSASCPSQKLHDARLVELARAYAPRGVRFVAIDAEAEAEVERDRAEAAARGYPFPLLVDPSGAWADRFDATASTESFVLDRDGRVRYRGGIDSDRTHASPSVRPWLRDALEALLAGQEPPRATTTPQGCAIRRR